MNNVYTKQPEMRFNKFKNPILENDFMTTQVKELKRMIRMGMLIFDFAFLFFLIPDYLFNQSIDFKIKMTILRLVLFTLILVAYFIIPKIENWKYVLCIITFCEFLPCLFFLYNGSLYEHPNFMLQLLSLILMQLVFFIIPNRLFNSLIISILTWIIFIMTANSTFKHIPYNEYLSGYIYPILFMLAFSYWHIRYYEEKRIQFSTHQQLIHLLNHDTLTNIYNRLKFEIELNSVLSTAHIQYTLALLDIDFFKQINDSKGHLFGDSVLVSLSNLIQTQLDPKDLFARWGGEEFVILFYDHSLEDAIKKVEAINTELAVKPFEDNTYITCSYGITEIQPNDTLDSLVHRADQLMYQAKERGRNQYVY